MLALFAFKIPDLKDDFLALRVAAPPTVQGLFSGGGGYCVLGRKNGFLRVTGLISLLHKF